MLVLILLFLGNYIEIIHCKTLVNMKIYPSKKITAQVPNPYFCYAVNFELNIVI